MTRLFAISLLLISIPVMAQQPLPVPALESHKPFLMGEWKPDAPTVVAFKDPFCPYCIKALEKKQDLSNANVFLFWYPIFGVKSDVRVAEFFKCKTPADDIVINAVLQRKSPGCDGAANSELQAVNKAMYDAYYPPGVPAFYLGGQKISFAEVKSIAPQNAAGSVALDWDRYLLNQLKTNTKKSKKAAIYLDATLNQTAANKLLSALANNTAYDWYIFSRAITSENNICQSLVGGCSDGQLRQLQKNTEEFELLFGLDSTKKNLLILNGFTLNPKRLPEDMEMPAHFWN